MINHYDIMDDNHLMISSSSSEYLNHNDVRQMRSVPMRTTSIEHRKDSWMLINTDYVDVNDQKYSTTEYSNECLDGIDSFKQQQQQQQNKSSSIDLLSIIDFIDLSQPIEQISSPKIYNDQESSSTTLNASESSSVTESVVLVVSSPYPTMPKPYSMSSHYQSSQSSNTSDEQLNTTLASVSNNTKAAATNSTSSSSSPSSKSNHLHLN